NELVWYASSDPVDGYLVEASSDDGRTYQPLGTAGAKATFFELRELTAGIHYVFRVTAFNAAGLATAALAEMAGEYDGSIGGWYRVSFGKSQDTHQHSMRVAFQLNSDPSSGGEIELINDGWIWAESASDAVRRAIKGSFRNNST